MTRSPMSRLRQLARSVTLALVVAFMLPIVLQALPDVAYSAEAQLARDIAATICNPQGTPDQPGAGHDHSECCILCATGLPPVTGSDASPIIVEPPRGGLEPVFLAFYQVPARELAFVGPITLRGPPGA